MRKLIKRLAPQVGLRFYERHVKNVIKLERGIAKRVCPCCGFAGRFLASGTVPELDARCPRCGSMARHRLAHMWLSRLGDNLGEVLHFAPEASLARELKGRATGYRSADIDATIADIVLDIEAIDLPDQSVDTIVCFHILEHVDDRKALSEMWRILRPGGRALLMFPIVEGWAETYEDPSVVTPDQRRLYYGQFNHVRYFGADVRDRIRGAGFDLSEVTAVEPDVARYSLKRGEKIFIATRPG